jgi:hypothetical protein
MANMKWESLSFKTAIPSTFVSSTMEERHPDLLNLDKGSRQ